MSMSALLDTSTYARVFALDTQLVFEARPLAQLDWARLSSGPILLIITPQVMSEVDAKKRDGRLGPKSRAFNKLMDGFLEAGAPVEVVASPTRVDLALVRNNPIDWGVLDDLERDSGDDRIVAQVLNAQLDDPRRVEVLSFDVRPRDAARRHGLKAVKPDESWLLDPEPSADQRRAADLEQQLRALRNNEPKLRVSIKPASPVPLLRLKVPLLDIPASEALAEAIIAANPRQRIDRLGMIANLLSVNGDYEAEYSDWVAGIRNRDVPNLDRGLERLYAQHPFEIEIENVGDIPAEHLIVEVTSGNCRVHAAPLRIWLFGPPAPSTTRDHFAPAFPELTNNWRADRNQFYRQEEVATPAAIEYHCQDFRQNRRHVFSVVLELDSTTGNKAHLEVRVTAGNMRGQLIERCILDIADAECSVRELVDLERRELRSDPPIFALIVDFFTNDRADEMSAYFNNGTPAD